MNPEEYVKPLAEVKIRYLGGYVAEYSSNRAIQLGFDHKLGYVSVYMDGHEYSHEWELVAGIWSDGTVTLLDIYMEAK